MYQHIVLYFQESPLSIIHVVPCRINVVPTVYYFHVLF